MPSIVALDIETTGLDPQKDAIIEVGAVRFNGKRIEAEWSSLANPGRPIPPNIIQLTGITNDMVRNAPIPRQVATDLASFVGSDPVLGHNIAFDLSFLKRLKILGLNEAIDTYDLASVLLPTASRYNLSALCQASGILLTEDAHRALNDARATHLLYQSLYDLALALPVDLIAEIVRQSEPVEWSGSWFFKQILRLVANKPVNPRQVRSRNFGPLYGSSQSVEESPLEPKENPEPLNVEEVSSILEFGGPFAHYFEAYEYRPQQVEMLRAVSRAFSEGYHLMVEAGTGTGKSMAYLIPAALWATQNGQRVVISTNTINLQDQLITKDIPDLCNALQMDLRAIVLKGRSNYLCPRRFEGFRQRGPESPEEMRLLGKVLVWLNQGGSGDRTEINLNNPAERDAWMRISAEDEGCRAEVCLERTGGECPFYKSRQAAQSAHLIIVNHALLLADVATGSRVLPDYHYLIVDEAHHLESATTNALSFRVTESDINRLLRELGGVSSGVLGHILTSTGQVLRPSEIAACHQIVQRATDLLFRLDFDFKGLFRGIEDFLVGQREGRSLSVYGQQERITPATRTLPAWTNVEISWDTTHETMTLLLNLLAELQKYLGEVNQANSDELEDLTGSLATLNRRLMEVEENVNFLVTNPRSDLIYWAEISPNRNQLSMQIAPLHVGSLMEQYLWHEKASIILTSATLTAGDSFDYLRGRLSADEADELALGSPFDYETSALLYLVNDIPEPADAAGYQHAVEQTITRLAKATGGRMLVLFTSYAQLRRTSQVITPILSEAGIFVYEQGEGASANTLLETFRDSDKAVLLGTRAFWEGVDIPGEALSVLVIVKLPFDVPSDPIIAARSETFEDPFGEFSLPEAILRFRQGFGRLIRTQSDRGVVVVLDRRLLTKKYGRLFIESLPGCTRQIASMSELPKIAARWLNM